MGDVTPESVHVDELIRRETRIGELLAEVDQERRDRLYFKAERNRLLTEVERLRVELHAAKAAAKGYHDLDEANRAKVERLREALHTIAHWRGASAATGTAGSMRLTAREALNG